MGPQFFETLMGRKFYDGTMPRLAKAAADIAATLEVLVKQQAETEDPERAKRAEAWHALVGEMIELLYTHDVAWSGEEDSVRAEHALLIEQTKDLLARIAGRKGGQ